MTRTRRLTVQAISVVLALLAWQFLVTVPFKDQPFATVPEIGSALVSLASDPDFWVAVWETVKVAFLGLALSTVVGVAVGVLIGQSEFAFRSSRFIIEFFKPLPPIVVLPLLILVLGPTPTMGVTLVFLGCVFVLATQTAVGVHDIDPVAMQTARSFRLTAWQRLRSLIVPTAFPFVATGVRICASGAIVIALVSEIIGGAPGLGKELSNARVAADYPSTYALVVVFGILGVLVNSVISRVEHRVLFWHASVRSELPA
ncbi:MAG: ABC transporter permease subunit [Phycicoccus sp.]|nr:ABC transporter permease subunit [Phycicoccus sp.]